MLRLCATLTISLWVAACGSPADRAPAREMSEACRERLRSAPSPTPAPSGSAGVVDTRLECGTNQITVSGALDAKVSGPLVLRIAEIFSERTPKITHFLSGATAELIELSDGTTVKVAFDIAPGEYTGDGDYKITGQRSPRQVSESVTSPFASDAFVQAINATTLPPTEVSFNGLAEPCSLTVSDHGSVGDLRCPKLTSDDGRTVSVRWRWKTARA